MGAALISVAYALSACGGNTLLQNTGSSEVRDFHSLLFSGFSNYTFIDHPEKEDEQLGELRAHYLGQISNPDPRCCG